MYELTAYTARRICPCFMSFLYYLIFSRYQNIKLWRLFQCSIPVTSRGIFGIFRGISKFVFTYSTIYRGVLVGKQGPRPAGFYLDRVSLISEWGSSAGTSKLRHSHQLPNCVKFIIRRAAYRLTLHVQFTQIVIVKDMRYSFFERLLQISHM
jgi:hypothetical protein